MSAPKRNPLDEARSFATGGYVATLLGGIFIGMAAILSGNVVSREKLGEHVGTLTVSWPLIQALVGVTLIVVGNILSKQAVSTAATPPLNPTNQTNSTPQ